CIRDRNSTEQQDSTSFNEARLKKEVNSSFSIPGLTLDLPLYFQTSVIT
ncbi:hypothetical protein, partial [Escherichia coli]